MLLESVGSLPTLTSTPSAYPSPSESALVGSVPILPSAPSAIPSPSVSAIRGCVPASISSPSVRPSPSESALVGSLAPELYSARSDSPSSSKSDSPALMTRLSIMRVWLAPPTLAEMLNV